MDKFFIPREREKIFLADLKISVDFCCKKYDVSRLEIEREAKRIFPALNLSTIGRKKNG
jgi:hypothetical protein